MTLDEAIFEALIDNNDQRKRDFVNAVVEDIFLVVKQEGCFAIDKAVYHAIDKATRPSTLFVTHDNINDAINKVMK